MIQQLLFDKIDQRIALDKEDGDYAYFHALSLKVGIPHEDCHFRCDRVCWG